MRKLFRYTARQFYLGGILLRYAEENLLYYMHASYLSNTTPIVEIVQKLMYVHRKNVVCIVLLNFPAEQQKALAMQQLKEEAERATAMQIQFAKDQEQAHRENIERLEKKMREDAEANRKHYEENDHAPTGKNKSGS